VLCFKKILAHNISRLTRVPIAFIKNDAIGFYNRLVNGIILLILQKFGFPITVTNLPKKPLG
jgi:hypothetical protein